MKDGAKRGVHAILWQDSYSALEQDDNNIMSYFNLKVAFDMSPEEFSRSVGANDISLMSENNATALITMRRVGLYNLALRIMLYILIKIQH